MSSLVKVSRAVYYSPRPEGVSTSQNSPHVILVFGWMNAQLPHLQKYLDQYRTIYPKASQIVVLSESWMFLSTSSTVKAQLQPAITLLKSEGMFASTGLTRPGIIIHTFSNGGALNLIKLSAIIRGMSNPGSQDVPIAHIYDSLPGSQTFSATLIAFTASIKSPLIKFITYVPLTCLWLGYWFISTITRTKGPIIRARETLNQTHQLMWTNFSVPRLYIYSDVDKLVKAADVEGHIAEAKQKGLTVYVEKFVGSAHVAHARKDPERYWSAIQSVWQKVLATHGSK